MKLYLIFVAVLANFCCHGVSGGTIPDFNPVDPRSFNELKRQERFLPDLPGGQSLDQSGSYSTPSETSNTGFQLMEKFKDLCGSLVGAVGYGIKRFLTLLKWPFVPEIVEEMELFSWNNFYPITNVNFVKAFTNKVKSDSKSKDPYKCETCGLSLASEKLIQMHKCINESNEEMKYLVLAKLSIFGIFNELLSTQNVNVARFARNVEWDFFGDFQTPCFSEL